MTDALCDALQVLEYTISYTFDVPLGDPPLEDPPDSLSYTKHQKAISEAMRLLKLQLGMVHASLDRTRSDVAPPDSHKAMDLSNEVGASSVEGTNLEFIPFAALGICHISLHHIVAPS
jgi:hypothetical protein